MPTFGQKEWEEHAALVGNVTLSWNRNVHQLLRIFSHLTGLEAPLADVIFFSVQSDNAQRRLIRKVADATDLKEADRKKLGKLLDRLEKAAGVRNLAVHMIFAVTAFDPETGTWAPKVVPALGSSQDRRLEKDFAAQFRKLEADLEAIYRGLEDWLVHTPFPTRSWDGPPFPLAHKARNTGLAEESAWPVECGRP